MDRRLGHHRQGRHGVTGHRHAGGGGPTGQPLRVAVAARRHELPVDPLLPELHLDGAALPQHRRVGCGRSGRVRPRLDRNHRRPAAEQVRSQLGHGPAALVPAVGGRVAQAQVGRHVGRHELAQEPVPTGHRQHHDGHTALVRRHDQPLLADGCRAGGRHRQGRGPGIGRGDPGGVVGRGDRRLGRGATRQRREARPAAPAFDGRLEDRHPARGDRVGVPLSCRRQGSLAQAPAQVVVGSEPEQGCRHPRDRLGRDEQPVDLVPDDLARPGGAVEADGGDARSHRLLQAEREPLGAGGERADAGPGPLGGHVGRAPGQLDAVPEPPLAGLADQVRALVALAEDPQPPPRQLVGDVAEGVHQLGELLLHHQAPGRHDRAGVEQRARGEALRERVGHRHDLGGHRAQLRAQPCGDRRGQQRDHVGARGVDQQRLHARGALRGRPVLLVDHDDPLGSQLDRAGQQRRGDGDQHVGRDLPQAALEPDVGERRELLVPPGRHQQRLTLVQRLVVRAGEVDEVLDADAGVDGEDRLRGRLDHAEDGDVVAGGGQGVGLGDGRALGAAELVRGLDEEGDLHSGSSGSIERSASRPSGFQRSRARGCRAPSRRRRRTARAAARRGWGRRGGWPGAGPAPRTSRCRPRRGACRTSPPAGRRPRPAPRPRRRGRSRAAWPAPRRPGRGAAGGSPARPQADGSAGAAGRRGRRPRRARRWPARCAGSAGADRRRGLRRPTGCGRPERAGWGAAAC